MSESPNWWNIKASAYVTERYELQKEYSDGDMFFVAGRTSSYSDVGKPIFFDQFDEMGEKGMMDIKTGVFTAPKDGRYVLAFQGTSGEANTALSIRLKDGKKLATNSYTMAARQDISKGGSVSMKTTANLKKGDTVSVVLEEGQLQEDAVFIGFYKQKM